MFPKYELSDEFLQSLKTDEDRRYYTDNFLCSTLDEEIYIYGLNTDVTMTVEGFGKGLIPKLEDYGCVDDTITLLEYIKFKNYDTDSKEYLLTVWTSPVDAENRDYIDVNLVRWYDYEEFLDNNSPTEQEFDGKQIKFNVFEVKKRQETID